MLAALQPLESRGVPQPGVWLRDGSLGSDHLDRAAQAMARVERDDRFYRLVVHGRPDGGVQWHGETVEVEALADLLFELTRVAQSWQRWDPVLPADAARVV